MSDYNEFEFDSEFFVFYFTPLISSLAIFIIVSREYNRIQYNITIKGIQAMLIGLSFLLFCLIIFYNIFIKIPKKVGGWNKVYEVIKLLLRSEFLYIFLITNVCIEIMIYLNLDYKLLIYGIILLICFYFQNKFIKKIKNILFTKK